MPFVFFILAYKDREEKKTGIWAGFLGIDSWPTGYIYYVIFIEWLGAYIMYFYSYIDYNYFSKRAK